MVKAKKQYGFNPDYAIPPGETLKETIEFKGMTQRELSKRTGLTVQSINRIYNGDQPINYETANKLELVTGVPARFWNNLESKYREQIETIKELKRLNADISWLDSIPVSELTKRGLIQKSSEKALQLREVLKFFEVSSVSSWEKIWTEPKVAARRSSCFDSQPGHAATWIRIGEILAMDIECKPFDKNLFKQGVQTIRGLTFKSPKEFIPQMIQICAQAGVALSLVPEMPKVPWNGATKWLTPKKAMIIINLRGKREDKFWFSFFHEAGHVINDNKKSLYINDHSYDPVEKKADEFATDILFPDGCREQIRSLSTKVQIKIFAKKVALSPGIIAGQYQFLTGKWSWYQDLIKKIVWEK